MGGPEQVHTADAELQTDVMRFVAILALCLVAVSTLIDQLPAAPVEPVARVAVPEPPITEPVQVEPSIPEPEPVFTPEPQAQPQPRPAPRFEPPPRPAPRPVVRVPPPPEPAPVRVVKAPDPVPRVVEDALATIARSPAASSRPAPSDPAPPAPVPEQPTKLPPEEPEGFTLRFESDAAMLRLLAARRIGLYVLDNDKAYRLVDHGGWRFEAAPGPTRYHAMARSTVPDMLERTLARDAIPPRSELVWAVTLSQDIERSLGDQMRRHDRGALIISPSGRVRLLTSNRGEAS